MATSKKIAARRKVYSEFFTSFAVAWATAGTISPLFVQNISVNPLALFLASVVGTAISLESAIIFMGETKK